jgi:hypothetical protein
MSTSKSILINSSNGAVSSILNNNMDNTNNNNGNVILRPYGCSYFNFDELVWARLGAYPWWPCRIIKDEFDVHARKTGKTIV